MPEGHLFTLIIVCVFLLSTRILSRHRTSTMADTKILFIGGTGYLGKFIVEASAKAGHPSFLLVRESSLSNPEKAPLYDKFKSLGVQLVFVRWSSYLRFSLHDSQHSFSSWFSYNFISLFGKVLDSEKQCLFLICLERGDTKWFIVWSLCFMDYIVIWSQRVKVFLRKLCVVCFIL